MKDIFNSHKNIEQKNKKKEMKHKKKLPFYFGNSKVDYRDGTMVMSLWVMVFLLVAFFMLSLYIINDGSNAQVKTILNNKD